MRLKFVSLASSILALLSFAKTAYADTAISGFDDTHIPFTNLGQLLSNILALLFFLAGVLAFIFIIIGGIQWITAGGDAKAASAARDRITAAVVGLLVVVAAFAITLILNVVFGINLFYYNFPGTAQTAGGP